MLRDRFSRFHDDQEGGLVIYGLILFITLCVMVGLSMDVANAYKVRSEMQVAADTAAHAALVNRMRYGKDGAITRAIAVASDNLSTSNAGPTTITSSDVEFGRWNPDTRTFTVDASSTTAVRVTARRTAARGNSVDTFLLSTIGLASWQVTTRSVMETYRPPCLREGFVAEKIVDIQSNNGFEKGFCIHSNSGVSINQNNYFEAGTIVSMPDLDDLQIAASGFKKNDGLLEALRESFYKIRILNRITDINTALAAGDVSTLRTYTAGGDSADTLDYLTQAGTVNVGHSGTVKSSHFTKNRINVMMGSPGCSVKFDKDSNKVSGLYSNFALLTNCKIDLTVGPDFENVLISTTNVDINSISSPAGSANDPTNLGKDDSCSEGGGVNFVTLGGIKLASGMNAFGAQLMALKDVQFSANANGVEGISIVSGGRIDGTSNMKMGFCGNGNDHNFEIDYYRLAA